MLSDLNVLVYKNEPKRIQEDTMEEHQGFMSLRHSREQRSLIAKSRYDDLPRQSSHKDADFF